MVEFYKRVLIHIYTMGRFINVTYIIYITNWKSIATMNSNDFIYVNKSFILLVILIKINN